MTQRSEGILRFSGWNSFADTFEPYREWEFLIPVEAYQIRAGDLLLEIGPEKGGGGLSPGQRWDGCRFQIRREGRARDAVIGNLEEWEAVPFFGGALPPWPLEGFALERLREALMDVMPAGKGAFAAVADCMAGMVRDMVPEVSEAPAADAAESAVLLEGYQRLFMDGEGERGLVFHATSPVSGTPVRAGDFLVWDKKRFTRRDPRMVAAVAIRVPRAQLATVDAAIDVGAVRPIRIPSDRRLTTREARLDHARRALRRPQRPEWRDASSPLIIVRPLVSPVSEPIEADSDQGALFELLAQVSSNGAA